MSERFEATVSAVLAEVYGERLAQQHKWGEQNHPNGTGWGELKDRAEAAIARCDSAHRAGRGTWEHILTEEYAEALAEADPARIRRELIQVAAVAVAWVEAIDRAEEGR